MGQLGAATVFGPQITLLRSLQWDHYTSLMFTRFGTVMMPSWAHPTAPERFLHKRLGFIVSGVWKFVSQIFRLQASVHGLRRGRAARHRLRTVLPRHVFVGDLRSAFALAPTGYYRLIAEGRILPYHSELSGFSRARHRAGASPRANP